MSSFLKIRVISDIFFGENIDWWSLLSNHHHIWSVEPGMNGSSHLGHGTGSSGRPMIVLFHTFFVRSAKRRWQQALVTFHAGKKELFFDRFLHPEDNICRNIVHIMGRFGMVDKFAHQFLIR
jgi:hypothetical protein